MDDVRITFTMNDSYFREFHSEWISVVGRGWRVDRIMIPVYALVGIGSGVGASVFGLRPLWGLAFVASFAAVFESWKYARRKAAWYRFCRSLPWHGREMRIAVRGGLLVQENDYDGDRRFTRTGSILMSPNGYLVRYTSPTPVARPGPEISSTNASLYIPHRAIVPGMSREEFAKLVGAT